MTLNVLVSSAGRRVALLSAFRDALGQRPEGGLVMAADSSSYAAASWCADEHFVVPPCTDPAFVEAMLEVCVREHIGLVVPTIDTELPVWAAHREQFLNVGTLVAVSSPEAVQVAADKRETYHFLQAMGLPTVEQSDLAAVLAERNGWPYPFIVKPAKGSASQGVVFVEDEHQLAAVSHRGDDVVVQHIAPGKEYTVDVFADRNGVCLGAVPRERLEVRGGEVVKARTSRVEPVIEMCERVIKCLPGAFGVLNVQLFYDEPSGDVRIIEINPRFAGGFPLAHRAGIPFVRWLLNLAESEATDGVCTWQSGLVMLRYDEGVFVDQEQLGPW